MEQGRSKGRLDGGFVAMAGAQVRFRGPPALRGRAVAHSQCGIRTQRCLNRSTPLRRDSPGVQDRGGPTARALPCVSTAAADGRYFCICCFRVAGLRVEECEKVSEACACREEEDNDKEAGGEWEGRRFRCLLFRSALLRLLPPPPSRAHSLSFRTRPPLSLAAAVAL